MKSGDEFVHSKMVEHKWGRAYMKVTNCTNVTVKIIGKYLFKTRCTWENKVRGTQTPLMVTKK
jgi:hypothetical protein